MPKEDWIKNTIENIFKAEGLYPKEPIRSVLDVACGLSLKSQYITADIRVGVDIYRPYLEKIDADVPYAVIQADIRDLDKLFLPNSFDLVIALDVVEHLEKDDALKLMDDCEAIARKAVVIETPKGFIPQNMDILGLEGHEWQTHRSSWEPEEFEARGYNVILRDYTMNDVQRHTDITDIDPNVTLIDAIKHVS